MHIKVAAFLAVLATANGQGILDSLTSRVGGAIETRLSSYGSEFAATYTGPGAAEISSAAGNPSAIESILSSARSRVGEITSSAASAGSAASTSANAAATSTGGASYNQVAGAGLGAALVAGAWNMV